MTPTKPFPIPNPRIIERRICNRVVRQITGDWTDRVFHCTANLEYDDGGATLWLEVEAAREPEGLWYWVRTDLDALTYPINGTDLLIDGVYLDCPGGEKYLTEWIREEMETCYRNELEERAEAAAERRIG